MAAHSDWAWDEEKERIKREETGSGEVRASEEGGDSERDTHTPAQIHAFACITSESLSSAAPEF